MRKKRSWIFIVAGGCCALLAVLIVQRHTGKKEPAGPAFEGIDILLASRDIRYGEQLVLEGEGENANVILMSGWPGDRKPDGALTKATDITEHVVRAAESFVKHEVILAGRTVPDEEFVPPDMEIERISVDKDEIRSGLVQPGMLADILQIVGNEPRHFMRNVRVYAVGALDARRRPMRHEDPSPTAWLLIKSEDYLTFLNAKLNSRFLLVKASDPSIEGPLLVDASVREEAKRSEIQELLDEAAALMAMGDYEKALPILQRAAELHPEIADLCAQATEQIAACREKLARKRYELARRAVEEDHDYGVAMHHLDTIANEFADVESVGRQAGELRKRAEEALAMSRSRAAYEAAVKDLESCLADGSLPRAVQLVDDLKSLSEQGFEPEDGTQELAKTIAEYEKKVRDASQTYENDRMVLESYLRQGNLAQARTKLEQIKGKFPKHPGLAQLEASVAAKEQEGQQ